MSRCKLEFGDIVEYQGMEYHVIETIIINYEKIEWVNGRMGDNDFNIRNEYVSRLILVPVLLDFQLSSREPIIVTINSDVVFKRKSLIKIVEV